MDTPMSATSFRMMSLMFSVRDAVRPRRRILEEVPLRPGDDVLDYGCGPGGYTLVAADMVRPHGSVVAADIHPLAVARVERLAEERGLVNVTTVRTDCATGLPDASLDVVLLYDILHDLSEPGEVLAELHRVLRSGGVLSVNDHHLADTEVYRRVTRGGAFELARRGERTLTFTKTA